MFVSSWSNFILNVHPDSFQPILPRVAFYLMPPVDQCPEPEIRCITVSSGCAPIVSLLWWPLLRIVVQKVDHLPRRAGAGRRGTCFTIPSLHMGPAITVVAGVARRSDHARNATERVI